MRLAAFALAAFALAGCGYRAANTARDPAGPFVVVTGGDEPVTDAVAMAAAAEGARAELSREGQLAPGGEGTALAIELVRVDERSEGIAIDPASQRPVARGIRILVTGRAAMRGPTPRYTGVVDQVEVVSSAGDAPAALAVRDEAVRRAAHRLGEKLVRRLLGWPEPGDL